MSNASTITSFEAERRATSVKESQPIERMAAPSTLRRASTAEDGHLVAPFWTKGSDLMVAFPGEAPKIADAESVSTAFNSPGILAMPVDRTAHKAMIKRCDKAGETHRATTRLLDFAVRMPMSSRMLVLTEALARKFWIQTDLSTSSVTDWCTAFGMTRKVESLVWLAGRVFDETNMTGKQNTYRTSMFEAEEKALASVVERGTSAAIAAFESSNSVSEAWSAYERIDAVLRYRYLVTGEVARITPIRRNGTEVVAALSTPFKVREGEVMAVSESDRDGLTRPCVLSSLGYDEVHGLIGTFSSPGKRSRSDAIPTLIAAHAARESLLITGSPYLGAGNFTASVFRWTTKSGAEKAEAIERDTPLDVTLAGAPVGD